MNAESWWLLTSVIGMIAAGIYITDVATQLQVARQERLSLQQPQLWGQLTAGVFVFLRMIAASLLGVLVIGDSPKAQSWLVPLLSFGNVMTVLAVVALIVGLHWTVHQDDETISNAESGTPNAIKATADSSISVKVTGAELEAEITTPKKEE